MEYVSLEYLLARSDVLSIYVSVTKKNTGLISEKEITMMKDRAFLVNTPRGVIVDEHTLKKALYLGKLAEAGLDVLSKEPPILTLHFPSSVTNYQT